MITSAITGTGVFCPPYSISNEELVDAFNQYVRDFNKENETAIAAGEIEALRESSAEFIVKASGIKSRYVVDKSGLLDPKRLRPRLKERSNDEHSLQCEMSIGAARIALGKAGLQASDIDCVILSCSDIQRAYPAVSIEVQTALGIKGFAFDMNVACSSATFSISMAKDFIGMGTARRVLIVNPEICTGHLDFKDRDCHFIFGDTATACIVERVDGAKAKEWFDVLDCRLASEFSNNIRNNFGYLSPCDEDTMWSADKLFKQNGRKVFREVVPMVVDMIKGHLDSANIASPKVKRYWLHQANSGMNELICKKITGSDKFDPMTAPQVLDEFANTSSAGCMIAFDRHSADFRHGELGVICSFGAGYSVGSVIVRKNSGG